MMLSMSPVGGLTRQRIAHHVQTKLTDNHGIIAQKFDPAVCTNKCRTNNIQLGHSSYVFRRLFSDKSQLKYHFKRNEKLVSDMDRFEVTPVSKSLHSSTPQNARSMLRYLVDKSLPGFVDSVKKSGNKKYIIVSSGVVGVFPPVFYLWHRDRAPITGRGRIMMIKTRDSIEQGAKGAAKFESTVKCTADPVMDKIMARLIESTPELTDRIPQENWRIVLVKDPDIEAFAFPNGTLFIYEGLLKFATTDDQRAMLIGHEMARIFMSHPAELASREYFKRNIVYKSLDIISSFIPLPDILANKQYVYDQLFDVVLQAPQAKAVEKEADLVGLMFASKACYNPRAGVTFYNKLAVHELQAVQDCMSRAAPATDDSNDTELCATAKLPSWKEKLFKNADRAKYIDSLLGQALEWRSSTGKCTAIPPLSNPAVKPKEAVALSEQVDKLVEKIKKINLPEDPRLTAPSQSKSPTNKSS